jgi:ribosomal protein S18 acetylase RimI-like enzyme
MTPASTPPLEIGTLAPERAGEAALVFARAFFENPAWLWTLPDPARRERVLRFFYRAALRYAFARGETLATAGALRGAAILLPPERPLLDRRGLSQVGLWQLPFRAGLAAFARFRAQGRGFRARQLCDAPARHVYLWEIGVDPGHQSRGIGSAMLRAVARRSDAAGVPVYVDTTDPRNLSLYERHGFRIVSHGAFPNGGCRYWTLVRPRPE